MEHDFILDVSVYYDAGKYDYIDDVVWYKCKNCGISGSRNEVGDVECYWGLSCEEQIIKNIIE
jgi:hypothetical protein